MIKDVYKEKTEQEIAVLANRSNSYIHFTPAVRLGDSLAGLERFQHKSWSEIEPEARRLWEEKHQRPWGEFKEVVRQAWSRVAAQFSTGTKPADGYEMVFKRHFRQNYADSDLGYDQFGPAYHYGYDLAVDSRLQELTWPDIEPGARQYWNSQSFAGTWETFKEAVRYAWQETRARINK